MCISPNQLADGKLVSCRKCWQCRSRRIDDWVGRNIAESKTAAASHVVTLTYGDNSQMGSVENLRAAVLTYSDVQKYFKLLRRHGYRFRYFAVGEYGTKKGRAHWHVMIYWMDRVPEHVLRQNFMEPHWPHGWSFWDRMDAASVRYVCKYLAPDPDEAELQGFGPILSKNPPLGDSYFRKLAEDYANAGLSPVDLSYSFPEVKRNGVPVQFRMQRHTADNFLRYLIDAWGRINGDYPPASEPLLEFDARMGRKYLDDKREFAPVAKSYAPRPLRPPFEGLPIFWSETKNCFYCDAPDGRYLYLNDKDEGLPTWQSVESLREAAKSLRRQTRFIDPSRNKSSYRSQTSGE